MPLPISEERNAFTAKKRRSSTMFYPSNIHCHSTFCDGKNTLAEMAEAAYEKGYISLGFSGHSALPYENSWAMREEDYPAYFSEIHRLKKEYDGKMEILSGIEWDADTKKLPDGLDFVIGSVHALYKNGEKFYVDCKKELLRDVTDRLYNGDFLTLCEEYFRAVVKNAARKQVTVLGHFDLPMKYNGDGAFIREEDPQYLKTATDALDAILYERPDIYFEVNTGGMARAGRKYPYPAPALLSYLCQRGAKFVLTNDNHRAEQLGFGNDLAGALLKKYGGALYILRAGGFEKFPL